MRRPFLVNPLFMALLLYLTVDVAPIASAEELPNPYKLDLRKATDKEFRQVIAYASRDRVTIVAFAGTDAPWRIVKDVGNELAASDIPVNIAWAADNDENIQTAKVLIYAKGRAYGGYDYETLVGYLNYETKVQKGSVQNLSRLTMKIHSEHFK